MCKRTFIAILEDANLVGNRWGVSAHFKALRGQVPVGASPLAGQLHACALVLFYNLAQPKILHNATRLLHEKFDLYCTHALGLICSFGLCLPLGTDSHKELCTW